MSEQGVRPEVHIEVWVGSQRLLLLAGDTLVREYPVSTARNGVGEQQGCECTPRGRHEIVAKVGLGLALNAVLVGRVPTGEIYTQALRAELPERDWILTRILWLSGLEAGRNAGGEVDSKARYIYIHGTPDDVVLGVPGSRGCVRMRNQDMVDLFDRVEEGTLVNVLEGG